MISLRNIQKYCKYITYQGLNKTATTITQFKNVSNIDHNFSEGKQLLKTSSNSCGINLWKQFKTWSSLCSEESDVIETETNEKNISVDPKRDRSKVISPETSIRYMKSEAYKITYGEEPVWVKYRRNFKGRFVPRRSRRTCIQNNVVVTGNPCPICRDEYLVVHYTNVELLKQFIRPETGGLYSTRKSHVCQKKILALEVAIKKAKFYGYILDEVPFRKYDYSEYYPQWEK